MKMAESVVHYLPDTEISRRVMWVKAGWSVVKTIQRRREPEEQFADLMDKLVVIPLPNI